MKVALVGASGHAGSAILRELVRRGHEVVAIARKPEKIEKLVGVKAVAGEAADPLKLATQLRGVDAVISAVPFSIVPVENFLQALHEGNVKRYLVVGGAGSLLLPNGTRVVDSPDFPAEWKKEALGGAHFLDELKKSDLNWTFLSPSAFFEDGPRTGRFRLGTDHLLIDAQGKSSISFADFAIALIDELESPHHNRQRFTVGY